MKIIQTLPVTIIAIVILSSCYKEYETTRSVTNKNISSFLTKTAKEYSPMIYAIVDHIDDTLVFRCQATTRFIPNLDTFKLKYVDSIALGIGKNVYLGFTGDYSTHYVRVPNGPLVSTAELGNLYFYIYSDFYQPEPDSTYSIVNIGFLYNMTEPLFK
jgi:hypothetical protein